jgi:putative spermidine/putrescine transport system ATP-binding protein
LQRELKDLHERVGTTFIYVTHDQEEALSMSDRIAILRDGQIEQLGTPSQLYEKPASIFVANFLGKSNFVPVHDLDVQGADVRYTVGQDQFRLSRGDAPLPQTGELSLALRPERLTLYRNREDAPENYLAGKVVKVTYFGQLYEAIVSTQSAGDLLVTVDLAHSEPRIGDRVWVGWAIDSGVILAGRPVDADDAYAG